MCVHPLPFPFISPSFHPSTHPPILSLHPSLIPSSILPSPSIPLIPPSTKVNTSACAKCIKTRFWLWFKPTCCSGARSDPGQPCLQSTPHARVSQPTGPAGTTSSTAGSSSRPTPDCPCVFFQFISLGGTQSTKANIFIASKASRAKHCLLQRKSSVSQQSLH